MWLVRYVWWFVSSINLWSSFSESWKSIYFGLLHYQIGTDIEDYKCSWLVVKAMELSNEEQKKLLHVRHILSSHYSVFSWKSYLICSFMKKKFPGELWKRGSNLCSKSEGTLQHTQSSGFFSPAFFSYFNLLRATAFYRQGFLVSRNPIARRTYVIWTLQNNQGPILVTS